MPSGNMIQIDLLAEVAGAAESLEATEIIPIALRESACSSVPKSMLPTA
jgi:hypothetical protein